MWLDRFSGQTTPQLRSSLSLNRSISQLKRPELPQRVSSWTGLVNGAHDSPPHQSRPRPRTTLKELTGPGVNPGQEHSDTLRTLQHLLLPSGEAGGQENTQKRSPLSDGIEIGAVKSLSDLSSTDDVIHAAKDDQAGLEELRQSIQECDRILVSVEKNLLSFQADLSDVSAEIETLQNRSVDLTERLQRRKKVESKLSPAVDKLLLPSSLVRKITDGALDESWVRALGDLEKISKTSRTQAEARSDSRAAQDLRPIIDSLKDKAVQRIRDYVVAQIKALRSPNINAQVLQKNALSKFRDAYSFLASHQPKLEEEIAQAYINTMKWYYLSNFSRYKAALDKLPLHAIDKNDNLAQEDQSKRTAAPGGNRQAAGPFDAFALGRRIDILRTPNPQAMIISAAEENKSTHFLEIPFRAFNLALVDNATSEFAFMTGFFSKASFHTVSRRFLATFEPTLSLGQGLTKQLVESTSDCLGILTCVRLNQHFAFELQRRKVSSMEGYINGTSMILWPRFQMVMDTQSDALKKATASLSGRPAGSALGLTLAASSSASIAPHPTTQRFANFVQGILTLSRDAGDDEPVQRSLARLRDDYKAFVIKLSKGIADAKKRERFLFNNFSLVRTIIGDADGRLADEMKEAFDSLASTSGR